MRSDASKESGEGLPIWEKVETEDGEEADDEEGRSLLEVEAVISSALASSRHGQGAGTV